MDRSASRGPGAPAACAALALLIAVAYAVLLAAPVIYDDGVFVFANRLVTGPWPGLKAMMTSSFGGAGEYGPLSTLLHWALFRRAGSEVWAYRASSLLLHAANVSLFFLLARRWLGRTDLAFWAAAFFALHPAHSEVLALSSFKKHLLVALFGLGALSLSRSERPGAAPAAWLLLALGLLSKESALMIPCVAAAGAVAAAGPERPRRRLPLFAGFAAVVALYLGLRLRLVVPREWAGLVGGTWTSHLLTSGKILLWDVRQLAFPSSLSLEHSLLPVSGPLEAGLVLLGLAALAAFGAALYRLDRVAWFGAAWCAAFLAPFLNVAPFMNFSLTADRYLYMASAGFFLCALRLADRALPPGAAARRRANLALGALAAVYAAVAVRQAALYADPGELWAQAVERAPLNPRAHLGYAEMLAREEAFEEARAHLKRAIELEPRYPLPYACLADVYERTGRLDAAVTAATIHALQQPEYDARLRLGVLRLKAGDAEQACLLLQDAVRREPRDGDGWLALGQCQARRGRTALAERALYRAAAAPGPMRARALAELAALHRAGGDLRRGVAEYEQSLALGHWNRESVKALARLYLDLGMPARATEIYRLFRFRVDGLAALAPLGSPEAAERHRRYARELLAQLESDRRSLAIPLRAHRTSATLPPAL